MMGVEGRTGRVRPLPVPGRVSRVESRHTRIVVATSRKVGMMARTIMTGVSHVAGRILTLYHGDEAGTFRFADAVGYDPIADGAHTVADLLAGSWSTPDAVRFAAQRSGRTVGTIGTEVPDTAIAAVERMSRVTKSGKYRIAGYTGNAPFVAMLTCGTAAADVPSYDAIVDGLTRFYADR